MNYQDRSNNVILIADDDASDLFFIQQALSETCPAAKIIVVQDGQQAIDYLEGQGAYKDRAMNPLPTHIFLDIKMPKRSGLEVLRWLRSHPFNDQTPVVAVLSGSQITSDMEQARALGAEYYVKPVEYRALLKMVGEFCRRFNLV